MNIANLLTEISLRFPDKKAVIYGGAPYTYESINFKELESLSNRYANGWLKKGFRKGEKVVLFVRPSLKFHALVFSLFKIGVVPVLIDPGMGKKSLLNAIRESKPSYLIAEPIVHFLSFVYREAFRSIKLKITTNNCSLFGLIPLCKIDEGDQSHQTISMDPHEMAAILFTSGGTGKPKGVVYTNNIFIEQTKLLQELFNLGPSDTDLAGFPLFSLFTLSMGMSSIIPDMDPSKPSKADPKKLLKNILDTKPTFVAGSPSIWKNLGEYCTINNIQLPSIKYLVMFGAPVRNKMHKVFSKILPHGTTYTPYGATESLPVACISGDHVLEQTAHLTDEGRGTCVGKPAPGISIKIISLDDEVIESIHDANQCNTFEIGEIIVSGAVVTSSYYENELETKKSKILDQGFVWHRIGDLGYFDDKGRLWFCGRKAHSVQTSKGLICSVNTEALFNTHKMVEKTALIKSAGPGDVKISLVVQRNLLGLKSNKDELKKDLIAMACENDLQFEQIYFSKKLPVDIRHNIKIDRIALAQMAQEGRL